MSLSISDRTRRQVRLIFFAAAVIGTLIGINTFLMHLFGDPLADVRAYYDAGARLNAGEPLYVQTATTDDAAFYRYPPLLAILFRPLALLPYPVAAAIWEGLVIASFVALVLRISPDQSRLLVFGMLAMTWLWSLAIGQAQVPLTLFVAIGAPWSVALATNLKVFPILLAIWWLGRRDWRALGWFAACMAGLILFQLVVEPAGTLAFLGVFNLEQVGEVRNVSPYAISPWLWAGLLAVAVILVLRYARTPWGWPAAVALSVFATPRLLLYQLMTLLAGLREPGWTPARAAAAAAAAASAPPAPVATPTSPTTPTIPAERPTG